MPKQRAAEVEALREFSREERRPLTPSGEALREPATEPLRDCSRDAASSMDWLGLGSGLGSRVRVRVRVQGEG